LSTWYGRWPIWSRLVYQLSGILEVKFLKKKGSKRSYKFPNVPTNI